MQYDINMAGDHVTLLIRQPNLPNGDPQRTTILTDLETAVEDVLATHGLEAGQVQLFGGHTYSMIDPNCPECREPLKLIEPRLGPENCAYGTASCECGWRGDAIYRLIDLHETHSPTADDDAPTDPDHGMDLFGEGSVVRLTDIRPQYAPY